MKSTIIKLLVFSLIVSLFTLSGCGSNKQNVNTGNNAEMSEQDIDQLFGVGTDDSYQEEATDEDEVLELLGIKKERKEEAAVDLQETETSQGEDQLRNEISQLENKLSSKDNEISSLQNDISLKDDKISQLEDDYSKELQTPAREYSSSGSFKEDYDAALSYYYNRQYQAAIQYFEELLLRGTSNNLVDNCRYWIGECYYGLGNYNQAIIEFTKVFSFNKSNKMDDAQLKLGLCYLRLGDRERARQEFESLISDYPGSEYVDKAQQYLTKF